MAAQVARVTLVNGVNRIDINSSKGDFIVEIDGVPLFDSAFVEQITEVIDDSQAVMDRYLRFSRAATMALSEEGNMDFEDALCHSQITELLFLFNKNAVRYRNFKD